MKRILVWDLPTRLFHWLLAASFIAAFTIANVVDDDSATFVVHMLLGAVMAAMVVQRVLWGVVGSRYARFRSFAFGPRDVLAYLKGAVSGTGKRHVGHNPGSSVAIWAMLGLTLGLGVSGALMSTNEALEEVHEVLAYALLAVVVVHVAGVIWHTLRHRENITVSMVSGYKDGEPESAIPSAHPAVAGAFLVLTAVWAGLLVQGYDASTRTVTVPVVGVRLALGEGPEGGGGDEHQRGAEEDEEGEDDDD
jgi:cytochrome b